MEKTENDKWSIGYILFLQARLSSFNFFHLHEDVLMLAKELF